MINPRQIRGNAALLLMFAGGLACDAVAAVAAWLANVVPAFTGSSANPIPFPVRAGTLRNLRVKPDTNTSTTDTLVAVRLNGAPTALAVNVVAGSTALVTNVADQIVVAANDLVDLAMVNGAGGGAGNGVTLTVTVELV